MMSGVKDDTVVKLEAIDGSNEYVKKQTVKRALQSIYQKQSKRKPIKICRVCLNEGDVPLYGDADIEDLSESLSFFTGLEVKENDNLPKLLCHACYEHLQNTILFRKTAIENDQFLRETFTISNTENFKVTVKQEFRDVESEQEIFKNTLADVNTRYHCVLCSKDFISINDYGTHMLSEKHSMVRDKCPFCNRKFNYIQKHLSHHREYQTIKCDICNLKYLESMIKRHKETHFITPTFKCPDCSYETRYSGDFKVHKRKHTGERPYQCQHCSAKFINKSNLNRHEYTHKNQLPYPCDQCEREFYNERDLNMHTAADHQGMRDYLCNICGKAFGYRRSMIKHQRQVHKREKLVSGRKRAIDLENQDNSMTSDKKIKEEKVDVSSASNCG